ncbi:MAG TPA: FAD:protein FMN transferase [Kineosporiaceae bacterium]|nr:FAD:protein FMN transferase [Kineosporiaceae bacterium]
MSSQNTVEDASPYAVASWRALGTYVQLVVDRADRIEAARGLASSMLDEIDRACSRFRDDSDLSRANREAGRWVRVDPLLAAAVRAALDAAEQTEGLVDPTLGHSLVSVGYDRDFDVVRLGDGPTAIPLPAVTDAWRWVEVDPDGGVRVPDGVALDLGATGKAFAADLISAAIGTRLGIGCMLSLGGDVAVGNAGGAENDGLGDDPGDGDSITFPVPVPVPWQVAISETPDEPPTAVITLPAGGLATSTVLARRWHRGGAVMHHLLDPATGRPVDPAWRTASVIATSCLAANTASTATVIMGARAVDWLDRRGLSARLVGSDGSVHLLGDWAQVGA